jgi:hypothetical protein
VRHLPAAPHGARVHGHKACVRGVLGPADQSSGCVQCYD